MKVFYNLGANFFIYGSVKSGINFIIWVVLIFFTYINVKFNITSYIFNLFILSCFFQGINANYYNWKRKSDVFSISYLQRIYIFINEMYSILFFVPITLLVFYRPFLFFCIGWIICPMQRIIIYKIVSILKILLLHLYRCQTIPRPFHHPRPCYPEWELKNC